MEESLLIYTSSACQVFHFNTAALMETTASKRPASPLPRVKTISDGSQDGRCEKCLKVDVLRGGYLRS